MSELKKGEKKHAGAKHKDAARVGKKQSKQKEYIRRRRRDRKGRKGSKPTRDLGLSVIPNKDNAISFVDAKAASSTTNNLLQTVTSVTKIISRIKSKVICGAVIGYLSELEARGLTLTVQDPSQVHWAGRYMTSVILNAMQGVTPKAIYAPRFMVDLCQALSPKTVKYKNGFLAYSWNVIGDDSDFTWTQDIGCSAYATKWNCGVIVGENLLRDLYPPIVEPDPYSEEKGAAAFASLITSSKLSDLPQFKQVSFAEPGQYSNDVSAFSMVKGSFGEGFGGVGGFGTELKNEVFMRNPGLAAFKSAWSASAEVRRYCFHQKGHAGNDPIFCASTMMRDRDGKYMSSKQSPIIQQISFLNVVDVFARFVQGVVQKAVEDAQNQTAAATVETAEYATPNADEFSTMIDKLIAKYQCPLNFYDFEVMLRAMLMILFKDTQCAVQSLCPIAPSGSQANEWVAFSCGTGLGPREQTVFMEMPTLLAENLRSLTVRERNTDSGPQLEIPALGEYFQSVLDVASYNITITVGGVTKTFSPFTVLPPSKDQKSTATGKVVPPIPPSPKIGKKAEDKPRDTTVQGPSLFDGSYNDTFYAINSDSATSKINNAWNAWLRNLSSFVPSTTTIGTDGGLGALASILYTNFVAPTTSNEKRRDMHAYEQYASHDFEKVGADTFFDNYQILGTLCSGVPKAQIWEMVLSVMIKPYAVLHEGETPESSITLERAVTVKQQPILIPSAASGLFSNVGDTNRALASLCVRARNAPASKIDEWLTQVQKEGKGGLLGNFLTSLVPLASQVGGQVATQLLPQIPI